MESFCKTIRLREKGCRKYLKPNLNEFKLINMLQLQHILTAIETWIAAHLHIDSLIFETIEVHLEALYQHIWGLSIDAMKLRKQVVKSI